MRSPARRPSPWRALGCALVVAAAIAVSLAPLLLALAVRLRLGARP